MTNKVLNLFLDCLVAKAENLLLFDRSGLTSTGLGLAGSTFKNFEFNQGTFINDVTQGDGGGAVVKFVMLCINL